MKVILFLLLLFHIWLFTKIQFTAWPEMLSYPYLMTHGYSFYGDIIQPFVPLLPVLLTLWFSLFGLGVYQLFLLTLFFVVISDLILFYILHLLFSKSLSYFLLFIFIVLMSGFEGNGMWFDLAVVPFVLGSFLSALQWFKYEKKLFPFLTGLFLALALLIKLSAIFLLILLILLAFVLKKQSKYFFFGLISTSVIILFLCFIFFHIGRFNDFLYWGLYYPLFIIGGMQGYLDSPVGRQLVIIFALLIPSITIFFQKHSREGIISGLFCLSLLPFAIHRFAYFHLQPVLPFFVITLGFLISSLLKKRNNLAVVVCGISLIFILFTASRNIRNQSGVEVRFGDRETIQLSLALAKMLPHNKTIFFYNTPSQYFVFANLLPSKPWADTFPWYLELPMMQEKIVDGLEQNNQWVVYSSPSEGGQFELGSYKPKIIDSYIGSHYHKSEEVGKNIFIMQKNP